MALRMPRRQGRIALIQSEITVTAVWRKRRRYCQHDIALPDGAVDEQTIQALREQSIARGAPARARVSVVLSNEAARVRTIDLPARDPSVAARVLQNEPRRYFPVPPGRYAVSAVRIAKTRGSSRYLASAISDEAIVVWRRTLKGAWRCAEIIPAGAALFLGGSVVFARRPELPMVLDMNVASLKTRRRWKSATFEVQLGVAALSAKDSDFTQVGAESRSSRKSRRFAASLAAFASLLLLANAPLEFWGLKREAAFLNAARTQRKQDVAITEKARAALERMRIASDTIAHVLGNNGRTSQFLVELASSLPLDTHVLSMRLTGDTVLVELAGPSAAATMRKLQQTPRFEAIRLAGPVRREGRGSNNAFERFKVMATTAATRKEAS